MIETGWSCSANEGEISVCIPINGDGLVVRYEFCDEGPFDNKGCK